MERDTIITLDRVHDKMVNARVIIDGYLYGGEEVPEADRAYLRKVYNKVCEVLDLL